MSASMLVAIEREIRTSGCNGLNLASSFFFLKLEIITLIPNIPSNPNATQCPYSDIESLMLFPMNQPRSGIVPWKKARDSAIFTASKKTIVFLMIPLDTETANESKDRPMAIMSNVINPI